MYVFRLDKHFTKRSAQDPDVVTKKTSAKLTGLQHNTNYTVTVVPARHVEDMSEDGDSTDNFNFITSCQGIAFIYINIFKFY